MLKPLYQTPCLSFYPPTPMPAPQTVTKVVTSPLPLIFMGGIAVLSSAFSLLVIYGFIAIDFATILVVLFSILNLGFFSWAANQYLDKNAHKVLAISLMVISFAINLERYRAGICLLYTSPSPRD